MGIITTVKQAFQHQDEHNSTPQSHDLNSEGLSKRSNHNDPHGPNDQGFVYVEANDRNAGNKHSSTSSNPTVQGFNVTDTTSKAEDNIGGRAGALLPGKDNTKELHTNNTSNSTFSPSHSNGMTSQKMDTTSTGAMTNAAAASKTNIHNEQIPQSSRQDAFNSDHKHDVQDLVIDPTAPNVTHSSQIVKPVISENVQQTEVEDVHHKIDTTRVIKHIQVHRQPVEDTIVSPTEYTHTTLPTTHITETHAPTSNEINLLQNQFLQNSTTHQPTIHQYREHSEHTEGVPNVEHDVYHLIQPVMQVNRLNTTVHQTVVPIQQKVFETIVHGQNAHESLSKEEFLASGGTLDSEMDPRDILKNVMNTKSCGVVVDGPAKEFANKLSLHGETSADQIHTENVMPGQTSAHKRSMTEHTDAH